MKKVPTNATEAKKVYSKPSGFYLESKSEFFDSNESLLSHTTEQNTLYRQQPIRTLCKICNKLLPKKADFMSHDVGYVFCGNCGHLNGMFEDTELFTNALYGGANDSQSKYYCDPNFATRANLIYLPKLQFLISNLSKNDIEILDIGCGAGHFVYAALQQGVSVKGIDLSETMVHFGNDQIEHLLNLRPLINCSEQGFIEQIVNTNANVISAIGVIEHLRYPATFFDAFKQSKAEYLFYSVPMFSLSALLENIFPDIYPRQLSGGHTHLFTEESIQWLHKELDLTSLAEWRFGTDVMDLYRAVRIRMEKNGASAKALSCLNDGLGKNIDRLQAILDNQHFCSEIHCVVQKQNEV